MKKGFTLLELIIVIIIVGTLATLALPQYFRVVERARTAEATRALGMYRDAQIRYYAEHSVYTDTEALLDIEMSPPRFFQFESRDDAHVDPDDRWVGRATRTGTNRPAGYGDYVLEIAANGGIRCVPSTEDECERLGYAAAVGDGDGDGDGS